MSENNDIKGDWEEGFVPSIEYAIGCASEESRIDGWTSRRGTRIMFGDTDGNGKLIRPRLVPERALSPQFTSSPIGFKSKRAMVPMIPPDIRPAGNLAKYWILFEAEWKPIPPIDPLLLRPLGGPFYVVLAHWSLTDVERAVLGAFRQQEG